MSKGGSTTSEVKVPEYIEAAAQRNLNRADLVSQLGYVPQYGPTVAAFTPMQQAAFQNTAGAAGAFGMASPTSQQDITGGMAPPTTYANGVQGYSSAPLYEQMVAELAANRPGQQAYIDSFFIDPQTGVPGANASAPIDYTQPNPGGNTGAGGYNGPSQSGGGSGGGYSTSTTTMDTPMSYLPGGVNDPYLTSVPGQLIAGATGGIPGMTAGSDGVYTSPSGQVTSSPQPVARPDDLDTSGTSGGGFVSGGGSDGVGNWGAVGDFMGGIGDALGITDYAGQASGSSSRSSNSSNSSNSSGSSSRRSNSGGKCVIATHAVESGAFSPRTKREAVVWCMDVLHGKWWGEAIRRGYRHCGTKKIEQGKAREHYDEFRRYIDFARGKKRTARGAVTFTIRTVQFFVIGLVKRDA